MTWSHSDSFWCTSAEEASLGRASQQRLRKKSMKRSATRSSQLPLKLWPRAIPKNSLFIWTTVAAWSSKKSQILATFASSSRIYSIAWDTNTISCLTGWLRNKTPLNHWSRVKMRPRMSLCKWVAPRQIPHQGLVAISNNRTLNSRDKAMSTLKTERSIILTPFRDSSLAEQFSV